MGAIDTKSFKSGNSVAVRFPRGTGLAPDIELTITREGDEYRVKPKYDVQADKHRVLRLVERLRNIGPPDEALSPERIEFPPRAGLYD